MATACLRLRTVAPEDDFRVPRLYSRMTFATFLFPVVRRGVAMAPSARGAPLALRLALGRRVGLVEVPHGGVIVELYGAPDRILVAPLARGSGAAIRGLLLSRLRLPVLWLALLGLAGHRLARVHLVLATRLLFPALGIDGILRTLVRLHWFPPVLCCQDSPVLPDQ
jgi:hypothetical protein